MHRGRRKRAQLHLPRHRSAVRQGTTSKHSCRSVSLEMGQNLCILTTFYTRAHLFCFLKESQRNFIILTKGPFSLEDKRHTSASHLRPSLGCVQVDGGGWTHRWFVFGQLEAAEFFPELQSFIIQQIKPGFLPLEHSGGPRLWFTMSALKCVAHTVIKGSPYTQTHTSDDIFSLIYFCVTKPREFGSAVHTFSLQCDAQSILSNTLSMYTKSSVGSISLETWYSFFSLVTTIFKDLKSLHPKHIEGRHFSILSNMCVEINNELSRSLNIAIQKS